MDNRRRIQDRGPHRKNGSARMELSVGPLALIFDQMAASVLLRRRLARYLAGSLLVCHALAAFPQSTPGAIPVINIGANAQAAQFATLDFAQIVLEQQDRAMQKDRERQQAMVNSGVVSALDLAAPTKAIKEFNDGMTMLRKQNPQEAMQHLQKAIDVYPKFVSAHNYLGMAHQDIDDFPGAQTEFETASKLDAKFPGSFLNMGKLALTQGNYTVALENFQKALALRPNDVGILTSVAYAQNGDRQYQQVIETVARIHGMKHDGFGNAHYIAAVAAISSSDYSSAQTEFALFLDEDPNNPLAATARSNLDALNSYQQQAAAAKGKSTTTTAQLNNPQPDLANSEHLKAQIAGAGDETADDSCPTCARTTLMADANAPFADIPEVERSSSNHFTIRKVVDEVAVFFGVTSGGHLVSGLTLSDIAVRDDNKPPEKVLQFSPQSKLPLRIGLLVDTSGSVQPRFAFEKHAASKFLQQMLSNSSDLGFVAGFADSLNVTQQFTGDHDQLGKAVEGLTNGGGTALFDSVSRACWILAAYPERERVARVLVVLSDGEENASRSSLRQTIRDIEATGVTVYTISTKEGQSVTTEADKVLKMLAERSGGEAFFPGDMPTLSKSFDRLRDEIRSRYLVAYRPAEFEANGKYRTITISAEKDGKHLQVHARKGYHARAEATNP
jgi:Ca-activated chloride channel homolog